MKWGKEFFSKDAFSVVRIDNFRYFLTYRFFITMATLMQSVIIGWQVYDLTKNVLSLGMIGLVEVIPQVSIALFAGHYIDLYDRRKIILQTTLLLLFGSVILIIYSIPTFNFYTKFGIMPIFITVFLSGLVRGILMPAHAAFLGQSVPRNLLPNAATWNSTVWHVAAVLGPAVGGLIYGFSSIVPAYCSVFTFYLIGILLMFKAKSIQTEFTSNGEQDIFQRIKEGIQYVFKNQILLGAFSLDMFAVLFGGAVAMLPVFAADVLKVGPQGLGLLRACPAIGAIIMSIILTFRPPLRKTGVLLLLATSGFGLCMIGFAISTNFYLSAGLLLASGLCDNVSVVIRGTILQLFTPDEMRGRVAAVNSIFIGSSNELGAFESGLAARIMGLIPSVIFGGCMTLLICLTATKTAPTLRKLSLKDHTFKISP
jgi:MFS family permease